MTQLEEGMRMAKHDEVAASPAAVDAPKRRKPLADRPLAVVAGWIVLAGVGGGLWEWAGRSGLVNPLFISYPSAIGHALLKGLYGDLITVDARYTFVAVFLGFAGAAVLGIAVAFALAQNAYLKKVVDPFLTALNSLPRVALAPLFLMWFGIGLFSHVLMAASLTFFVVLANTTAGIESVDQDHLLRRGHLLREVRLLFHSRRVELARGRSGYDGLHILTLTKPLVVDSLHGAEAVAGKDEATVTALSQVGQSAINV